MGGEVGRELARRRVQQRRWVGWVAAQAAPLKVGVALESGKSEGSSGRGGGKGGRPFGGRRRETREERPFGGRRGETREEGLFGGRRGGGKGGMALWWEEGRDKGGRAL
eukprot:363682-Chlamydomonas_euryale.AAC.5